MANSPFPDRRPDLSGADWSLDGRHKPRGRGAAVGITIALVALGLVVVGVVAGAMIWWASLANPLAAPSTVDAPKISADFADDPEDAERTYRTRPLTVTGNVIFRGPFAKVATIQLSGSDALRPVFISFLGGVIPPEYHTIEVGQRIAATCDRLENMAHTGIVALDSCTLAVVPRP